MDGVTFVPGHRLSQALYADVVAPLLARDFPGLPYAAVLVGRGSDVLGYDTERSADHDWGPRLCLVLQEPDIADHAEPVLLAIESELPDTVLGITVNHRGSAQRPDGEVTFNNTAGRVRPHGITVQTLPALLEPLLGPSATAHRADLDPATWLSLPQQALLEVTAGPCFRDDTGELTAVREHLAFYPHDVWLHLMAARWQRIAQLEAFVGRAGELDDDLGSRLLTASLVRDVMHLALLQERRYAPYPKWLGTAYRSTSAAAVLTPDLEAAITAAGRDGREAGVLAALMELGRRHDALDITDRVRAEPQQFFERPYRVLFVEQYSDVLHAAITDPAVQRLPHDIGGIDTLTDSTLALANPSLRQHLAAWWRRTGEGAQSDLRA